jgi:hypothetical protein
MVREEKVRLDSPIQTSKPELSDSRSLKEADLSALINMST